MLADAPSYDYSTSNDSSAPEKPAEKPKTKKGLAIFANQNDQKIKDFIQKNSK